MVQRYLISTYYTTAASLPELTAAIDAWISQYPGIEIISRSQGWRSKIDESPGGPQIWIGAVLYRPQRPQTE